MRQTKEWQMNPMLQPQTKEWQMNQMLQPLRAMLNDLHYLTIRLTDLREDLKQDNVCLAAQDVVERDWEEVAAKIAKMVVVSSLTPPQAKEATE